MSPRNKNKQSFPFEVSNTNPSKCLFIEKKIKLKIRNTLFLLVVFLAYY